MKNVELKSLELHNFRSKTIKFEFTEENHIEGRNRSGKSCIRNAFFWLLTGCDDEDRANYNLFDTTIEYTHENSEPTIVTGVFAIDGFDYEISRTAKMGWVRKRGNDEYERKTSDDYSFSIDGIERSATEFKNWIEENFAPIEMLKCMINTQHFLYNIEDWRTQRKFLANIAGEITKDDFTGNYEELYAQLDRYTPEQLRERLKNLLMPLKKALGTDSIKGEKVVELDVLQTNLVNIEEVQKAEERIKELVAERDALMAERDGMKSPIDEVMRQRTEVFKKIDEKNREIATAKRKHEQGLDVKCAELNAQIRDIDSQNEAIRKQNDRNKTEFLRKQAQYKETQQHIEQMKSRLDALREENIAIKNREFSDFNCAYCGARLEESKIEELRAKFEQRKEQDRENNKSEGLSLRTRIEAAEKALADTKTELDKGFTPMELVSEGDLRERIIETKNAYPKFEETEEYKNLMAELESITMSMPEIPTINTEEITNKISDITKELDTLHCIASKHSLYTSQMQQIENVRSDMKKMAQERAYLEKIEQQLLAYEQEKADIVGMRINKFFDKCRVSMFATKKDGSLTPNCVITMDGRKSATLNKEGTITAGIDVSNAFCKYYNVSMPLLIDDYESISADNAVVSERQLITFAVKDCDLTLV